MKYKISEIQDLLCKASSKFVKKEEAEYFAKEYIEAHIRKYPKTSVIKDILDDIEVWSKLGTERNIKILKDKLSLLVLDCQNLGPSIKIKWIQDQLEKRAKDNGIAMISMVNSNGMHTMHEWVQGLAKRNLFAFASVKGGPAGVTPINGTHGVMGTNPFGYGYPAKNVTQVVDMATSQIPFYILKGCINESKPLEKNMAVDKNGEVTRDAVKALFNNGVANILPMGGNYKGYAINYFLEVMTTSLLNSKIGPEMDLNYDVSEMGGFIIAIDISNWGSVDNFISQTDKLNTEIRNQKPKKGVDKVIVPGDNNIQRLKKALDSGFLELEEKDFITLNSFCN